MYVLIGRYETAQKIGWKHDALLDENRECVSDARLRQVGRSSRSEMTLDQDGSLSLRFIRMVWAKVRESLYYETTQKRQRGRHVTVTLRSMFLCLVHLCLASAQNDEL